MLRSLLLLLPAVLLLTSGPARADEVQVALDAEGRLEQLEGARARAWGLLTEYPALEEARLYQDVSSGAFTLEVTEQREGRSVRRRVPLTKAQVETLRQQVSARSGGASGTPAEAAAPSPGPDATASAPQAPLPPTAAPPGSGAPAPAAPAAARPLDQEGRWPLIVMSTVMGASFYGWAIPAGIRGIDPTSAVGMYMVTTAASFFAPLLLTANTEVTWGTTAMFYAGGSRGPVHGLLLGMLAGPQALQPEVYLLSAMTGIAEASLGAFWAATSRVEPGTAHALMTGSDFGLGFGLGLYSLVTGAGAFNTNLRSPAASMLLGAAGGAVGGYFLARARGYTWGEAEAIRTSGLLGTYLTLPLVAHAEVRDVRALAGLVMSGGALGLVLGEHLVHGKRFGVGEAVLLNVGTVSGGLLGAGLLFILSGRNARGPDLLTASALGAAGGFAGTFLAVRDMPSQRDHAASLQVQVDPVALVAQVQGGAARQAGAPGSIPPVLRVGGTF